MMNEHESDWSDTDSDQNDDDCMDCLVSQMNHMMNANVYHAMVFQFIHHLINENLLKKNNRMVARKSIINELKNEYSFIDFGRLMTELNTCGLLESVNATSVVFSRGLYKYFEFPNSNGPPRQRSSQPVVEKKEKEVVYTKIEEASKVFEKIPERKLVERFVQFLMKEKILTNSERTVKKDTIAETLKKHKKRFKLTYEETLSGLNAYNYLKSDNKRFLVFTHTNDSEILHMPKKVEQKVVEIVEKPKKSPSTPVQSKNPPKGNVKTVFLPPEVVVVPEEKKPKMKKKKAKALAAVPPAPKVEEVKHTKPTTRKPKKIEAPVKRFIEESLPSSPTNSVFGDEEDNHLQEFIQFLFDEGGLNIDRTKIKREDILDKFLARNFAMTFDELINEMHSFGFLELVTNRHIVFSNMVFDMPGVNFSSPLTRNLSLCNLPAVTESPKRPATPQKMKVKQPQVIPEMVGLFQNDCLNADSEASLSSDDDSSELSEPSEPEKQEHTLLLNVEHCVTFSRLINRKFTWSPLSCVVCRKEFLVEMQLEEHLRTIHGEYFQVPEFISKGCISPQMFVMNVLSRKKKDTNIHFSIRNNFFMTLTLKKILYVFSNKFMVIASPSSKSNKIQADETYEFSINRDFFVSVGEIHSILLIFDDEIEFIEHYYVKTIIAPPKPNHNIVDNQEFTNRVLNPMKMAPLPIARPCSEIVNLFNSGFHLTDMKFTEKEVFICKMVRALLAQDPKKRLNQANYTDFFLKCIEISDCGQERDSMLYDLQQCVSLMPCGFYRIELVFHDKSELPPDTCQNDLLVLRKINSNGDYLEPITEQVIVSVQRIDNDALFVENVSLPFKAIDVNAMYNIRFKKNRITHRMETQALKIVERQRLAKYFFPSMTPPQKTVLAKEFEWFNKHISTNPEQMQAVKSIVNGTAYPSPYIIFGPPGTGKTSTIVETICQLWKIVPDSRILVTAQSNSACDEITKRLLQILPSNDIYRLFAPCFQRKMDRVDVDLQEISNIKTGVHQYPSWDQMYKYRVVVCTLVTAGRLVQARINKRHFTHVFIDECASATEPAALIPIAGVITGKNRIYGHIILAGDIQQLGPTIKSRFTFRLGYAKPMMERLMELPIYQKDPVTHKFNPNLLVKLVRSFRSHPKIIEFANVKFYEGDLIAKGPPEATSWAIGWSFLPNKLFPVIFVPCYGESFRDEITYSTYNDAQIAIVVNYVRQLLGFGINNQDISCGDIGIISPYKKQSLKIQQTLEQFSWEDIEVGTVETFQGREKSVIIISTVHSGSDNVGFLNNPKRLNVTVTRAKALMVIIGNPTTLSIDPNWWDLMYYCSLNGGCVTKIDIGQRPDEYTNSKTVMGDFNYQWLFPNKNQNVYVEDFL